jgi:proteasome lid subunit RPN8/RPN11
MLGKMVMEIGLTRAVLASILAHGKLARPEEACGLLLGHGKCITQVRSTRNVHPTPQTHFEIDPQALIDAHRVARQGGLELLGYYHSHPTGRAEPSVTDRALASGDGRVWAIVAGDDVAFWRDDEDGFAKLSYIVSEG